MPPILAKCQRCGRGFIGLPTRDPMIDRYAPALGSRVAPAKNGECGGRIELTAEGRLERQRKALQKTTVTD